MSLNRHVPAKIIAGVAMVLAFVVVAPLVAQPVGLFPAQASESASAEEEARFHEWYNADEANARYYHWVVFMQDPANAAWFKWVTTPKPVVVAHSADSAIAAHFGTGWLGQQARRVAQCESQMKVTAVSPTNDHGLFQINARYHAANFPRVTGVSFYNGVYDPHLNAKYARDLYNRSGWGPWTCKP